MLLVAATAMANRDLAVTVSAIDTVLRFEKRLERLIGSQVLLVVNNSLEAKRVGLRSESLNCH